MKTLLLVVPALIISMTAQAANVGATVMIPKNQLIAVSGIAFKGGEAVSNLLGILCDHGGSKYSDSFQIRLQPGDSINIPSMDGDTPTLISVKCEK